MHLSQSSNSTRPFVTGRKLARGMKEAGGLQTLFIQARSFQSEKNPLSSLSPFNVISFLPEKTFLLLPAKNILLLISLIPSPEETTAHCFRFKIVLNSALSRESRQFVWFKQRWRRCCIVLWTSTSGLSRSQRSSLSNFAVLRKSEQLLVKYPQSGCVVKLKLRWAPR